MQQRLVVRQRAVARPLDAQRLDAGEPGARLCRGIVFGRGCGDGRDGGGNRDRERGSGERDDTHEAAPGEVEKWMKAGLYHRRRSSDFQPRDKVTLTVWRAGYTRKQGVTLAESEE